MNLHLEAIKNDLGAAITKIGDFLKLAPHAPGLGAVEGKVEGWLAETQAAVELVQSGAATLDAAIKQLEAVIASAMVAANAAPAPAPAPADPAAK